MKLKQALIINLIIILFLFSSVTQSTYKEKVSGKINTEVAKPIIRIMGDPESTIKNLTLEKESMNFSVCNYDKENNITQIGLSYYISLDLSQKDAPITVNLYEIDDNKNEHIVLMTDYKTDNAKAFTIEGKQIHNYRLDVVYNPNSNVELQKDFSISIDIESIQQKIDKR